ncbi:uncharacterized protein LOC115627621 [Scaptodrosophila lebanonensis]|uniref:Uncharacterized protein LOC115627621 n=1 Tax=Drosophila lebanonensis TaxID=7225 RepID=A0A6J2TUF5_DROLE|nr:uncharacterized protein LOC115627621 [Scaptodrosophila lebanonensis]
MRTFEKPMDILSNYSDELVVDPEDVVMTSPEESERETAWYEHISKRYDGRTLFAGHTPRYITPQRLAEAIPKRSEQLDETIWEHDVTMSDLNEAIPKRSEPLDETIWERDVTMTDFSDEHEHESSPQCRHP